MGISLDTQRLRRVTFDTPIHTYCGAEIAFILCELGAEVLGEYRLSTKNGANTTLSPPGHRVKVGL